MQLWNRGEALRIETGAEITGGFDIGFDPRIPEATQDRLMHFVYWVEDRFSLPVTLWVDFKYNHYLVDEKGKRVGYRFYWAAFKAYPTFTDPDDIPVIELPVRTEHRDMEAVLRSFIEAISLYYMWLGNDITPECTPDSERADKILKAYLHTK